MYKISAILILLFTNVSKVLSAQSVNVADQLMENSKLNAVIVVVLIILSGIFIFLYYMERKIKKLEQEVKN